MSPSNDSLPPDAQLDTTRRVSDAPDPPLTLRVRAARAGEATWFNQRWFEQTGQLTSEIAAVRALTSFPNAQFVISGDLIRRIVATQATDISETIPLVKQKEIPPPSALQRTRTLRVRGTATTEGAIQIVLAPNDKVAELSLVYDGTVRSTARSCS